MLIKIIIIGGVFLSCFTFASTEIKTELDKIDNLYKLDKRIEAIDYLKAHGDALSNKVTSSKQAGLSYRLGKLFFHAEMDGKAEVFFQETIALDNSNPDAYFHIGLINMYANKIDKAVDFIGKAIEINNQNERYFLTLGRIFNYQQDTLSAIETFKKVIKLDDSNFDANFNLGNLYASINKFDLAESYYLKGIKEEPNNIDINYNLGQLYQNKLEYSASLKYFNKVNQLNSKDWRALSKLIQLNQSLNNINERNKRINSIYSLWHSGEIEELNKQGFYIRDQFEIPQGNVFSLEYFELKGDRARKYIFYLQDKETSKDIFEVSLGSYEFTNQISREKGTIGSDERLYHLDGYDPDGSHYTYGFYNSLLEYDEVKQLVLSILNDEVSSISSTIVNGEKEVTVTLPKK